MSISTQASIMLSGMENGERLYSAVIIAHTLLATANTYGAHILTLKMCTHGKDSIHGHNVMSSQ